MKMQKIEDPPDFLCSCFCVGRTNDGGSVFMSCAHAIDDMTVFAILMPNQVKVKVKQVFWTLNNVWDHPLDKYDISLLIADFKPSIEPLTRWAGALCDEFVGIIGTAQIIEQFNTHAFGYVSSSERLGSICISQNREIGRFKRKLYTGASVQSTWIFRCSVDQHVIGMFCFVFGNETEKFGYCLDLNSILIGLLKLQEFFVTKQTEVDIEGLDETVAFLANFGEMDGDDGCDDEDDDDEEDDEEVEDLMSIDMTTEEEIEKLNKERRMERMGERRRLLRFMQITRRFKKNSMKNKFRGRRMKGLRMQMDRKRGTKMKMRMLHSPKACTS